jgi:hypothetical protein
MKKPLTNNIYGVTLKRCAYIYVEAESPEEAMQLAEKWKDSIDNDDDFEDSDVEVDCCDSYPDEADANYMDTIYTQDEAIDVEEYIDRYESQEPQEELEAWQRGRYDMTNQLEINLED